MAPVVSALGKQILALIMDVLVSGFQVIGNLPYNLISLIGPR